MENPLQPEHFRRMDEAPDRLFYGPPRLVKHIDEPACEALAGFYADMLPEGGRILDLMSSCVSHLPEDKAYDRVIGHGINVTELRENPRLSGGFVQDLNAHPELPFNDGTFDAAICAVSVQYLKRPVEMFGEVARVLRPGAPFILSWSNRCFPTKAVAIWHNTDLRQKGGLVDLYFELTGSFGARRQFDLSPHPGRTDPLYAILGPKA